MFSECGLSSIRIDIWSLIKCWACCQFVSQSWHNFPVCKYLRYFYLISLIPLLFSHQVFIPIWIGINPYLKRKFTSNTWISFLIIKACKYKTKLCCLIFFLILTVNFFWISAKYILLIYNMKFWYIRGRGANIYLDLAIYLRKIFLIIWYMSGEDLKWEFINAYSTLIIFTNLWFLD